MVECGATGVVGHGCSPLLALPATETTKPGKSENQKAGRTALMTITNTPSATRTIDQYLNGTKNNVD